MYGPGGPFDVSSAGAMEERRIGVSVIHSPGVYHVRCDFTVRGGIEFIHREWWRSTAAELLARLRESTKPGAGGFAAAVARALVCLEQAERHLDSWKQGRDPFVDNGDSESLTSADGIPLVVPEPWVDLLVWDPLFLITSTYRCWRCTAESPVAALLAERYLDLSGGASPTSDDPPADAQHVVLVSDIERIPPDLERVLREAAPLIRRDRSRTAGTSYYMNHCGECGARFGDFFLGEVDGPFWAGSPEEVEKRGIALSLLPVKGMNGLRAGGSASDVYVWIHEQWWRGMVQDLITRLGKRDDRQSPAYAVALERTLGELSYPEQEIDLEHDRPGRAGAEER